MIIDRIKNHKLMVMVLMAYAVLFITKTDIALLAVKNTAYYLREMLEIMPVVFILIAIIEAWIPKKVIMRGLGDGSGLRGTLLSFALGSFSAGPIYAAFPLCKLLLYKGASIESIVIIISTWAVIKVPMLINEFKFLGLPFMVVRWILTVIAIVIMSKLINFTVKQSDLPKVEENDSKIFIKENYCIGCGLCKNILPEYFDIIDNSAVLLECDISMEDRVKLRKVMEKCPGNAIVIKED